MKEIGVGIIGFGFMGRTHTYAYKTMPFFYEGLPYRVRLVGVCNRTLEKAQRAKEDFGFEFATDDPNDLFADDRIQVINVCTPNNVHRENVIAALKAGKHVYCDKPLSANMEEAKDILDVLSSQKSITQMAFQNRFFPATMRAKELIGEGFLGNTLSFRASYLHSGSVDPEKPIGWKLDKSMGGGVLADLGSHLLDIIYYLLGNYGAIFAHNKVLYPSRPHPSGEVVDIGAEDLSILIVQMKNGGAGIIESSKIATGTNDELRFEIHGDKGAMRFNLMDPNWLEVYDNTLPEGDLGGDRGFKKIECVQRYKSPGGKFVPSKASIGWVRSHVHSLYNFLDNVYSNRQSIPSIEDGAYIQYVMDRAQESNRTNRWIYLD
ncbi:MAG TPA: Gfo/Idh/MocA family oxidoreductase [Clostridia bacterium]|nr:Gfo/Idh/MocA family oxidoreductase [Clostridia bacterium]